ncbi:TIGR00153 family protein [bacterium AH-315-E10]|nr:TIGR00153 family protein [bacterium AH-315-E10]
MRTFSNLFARSPFEPLQQHIDKVSDCLEQTKELFRLMQEGADPSAIEKIADGISTLEHIADLTKNDIRNNLPKSLFLPIDHGNLLQILTLQDNIADKCEDVAVLLTIKPLTFPVFFKEDFDNFLSKTYECAEHSFRIIKEIDELLTSSFGGYEAQKVNEMVEEVAFKEHETDILQRKLLKTLFSKDSDFSVGEFHLWRHLFEEIAAISNIAENLANRIRTTLELK